MLQWNKEDGLPAQKVAEKTADLDFASVVTARSGRQEMPDLAAWAPPEALYTGGALGYAQ